jgi:hypothetical protein
VRATGTGSRTPTADAAGALLAPVPFAPSRTAARLAERFGPAQLAGIETGLAVVARRYLDRLPAQRRAELVVRRPTLDFDSTDVEVYGRRKRGVAYTYEGKRAGRPLLASWARTGLTLAADLLAGDQDPRPHVVGLLHRALAVLPDAVCAPPLVRGDSGFFSGAFAVAADADFAIAAPRSQALWRAYAAIPADTWSDARDMRGAQVTATSYAPAGWPPGTYTIVRRVKVPAQEISTDPRSRRRRTIPAGQLALVLGGVADHAWAVSFLVTNIPAAQPEGIVAVEYWFRGRADIETRIKEAKLGAALRHLPSGDPVINRVWMWAAILAGWISAMLQSLSGYDQHTGRAHGHRFRHAGQLLLRLPPAAATSSPKPSPHYKPYPPSPDSHTRHHHALPIAPPHPNALPAQKDPEPLSRSASGPPAYPKTTKQPPPNIDQPESPSTISSSATGGFRSDGPRNGSAAAIPRLRSGTTLSAFPRRAA